MQHDCFPTGSEQRTVGRTYLRIDDGGLGNRQTQRRASITDSMVATSLVHYKTDVPPRRRDTEQVRRGNISSVLMISLLKVVGVFHQTILKRFGVAGGGGC